MDASLIIPWLSLVVLPLGWIEYKLLPRTRFALLLVIPNTILLYGGWGISAMSSPYSQESNLSVATGLTMVILALILWIRSVPFTLSVPGQLAAMPQDLVTIGAYQWSRHPIYTGHVLVISGGILLLGAREVFLVTPILWMIAATSAWYEEHYILEPFFGEAHRSFKQRTPFLMPHWGWSLWCLVYMSVWLTILE